MSWRDAAKQYIAAVTCKPEYVAASLGERRKMLSDAFPWGMREYTPYKIWNEECNRAVYGDPHPKLAKERKDESDRSSLWSNEC